MADTLADLMREVGIQGDPVGLPAPRPQYGPRTDTLAPAWQSTPTAQHYQRPPARTMRSPDVRAVDMRLAPQERLRAYTEAQRGEERAIDTEGMTRRRGAYRPASEQREELRQSVREATGVGPAVRLVQDVGYGANRPGDDGRLRTLRDTAGDAFGVGMGALSLLPATRGAPRAAPRVAPRAMAELPRTPRAEMPPRAESPVRSAPDAGSVQGGNATERLSLDRLAHEDPLTATFPWEQRRTPSEADVRRALERGDSAPFSENRGGELRANDHANRVATLMRDGWEDPITLRTRDGRLVVDDGYHRLAAARLRGDADIAVRYADTPVTGPTTAPDGSPARPPPDMSKSRRRPTKPAANPGGFLLPRRR